MHELAITRNIVAIVSEAAGDRRVRCVTLDVGRLSGVMPDAIAFCFEAAAEGTTVEGAKLDIRLIDGRARCEDCGSGFEVETIFAPCPCGSRRVVRLAGEELLVRTVELVDE
jgi:hydrogenase nickel incorporation protein HypA/HybF